MPDATSISSLFGLTGKVAIITGGAGSIGSGIVKLFVAAGATVINADRNLDRALAMSAQIGGVAETREYDQGYPDSIAALVDGVAQQFGRLDVMVNCAAAFGFQPFEQLDVSDFDRIMSVNMRGVALCCKAAAAIMVPARSGALVNISSISGTRFVLHDSLAYTASKAGINAITQNIAREIGVYGVRVNAVIPGAIENDTPDAAMLGYPMRGPLLEKGFIPLVKNGIAPPEDAPPLAGTSGTPQDIAAACLFLASDAGQYVTGQLIAVDGGITVS